MSKINSSVCCECGKAVALVCSKNGKWVKHDINELGYKVPHRCKLVGSLKRAFRRK
jgi:hypothetical protein